MKQNRYNQLLMQYFDLHGKHIIRVGEPLSQQAWDTIVGCANKAADQYAIETATDTLIRASERKVISNLSICSTEIILK